MSLYLKQKVFSWGDKFTVYDKNGNDKYYVKGEVFTLGKKLHVYDLAGNELLFIHQKVWSFLPRYYISRNGHDVAEVVKKIAFLRQSYIVDGFGWTVDGDFLAHDYEIRSNHGTVASISKQWFTFGDAYEINTSSSVDELDVLAVVLIIDACIAASNNASFNSSTNN